MKVDYIDNEMINLDLSKEEIHDTKLILELVSNNSLDEDGIITKNKMLNELRDGVSEFKFSKRNIIEIKTALESVSDDTITSHWNGHIKMIKLRNEFLSQLEISLGVINKITSPENETIVGFHKIDVLVKEGTELCVAIKDAILVAKKYQCKIRFLFNCEYVEVNKDSVLEDSINEYNNRDKII